MVEKEACMKALKTLNFDEGIVIGSYIGKLEQANRSLAEQWIKTLSLNIELMDTHYPMWRQNAQKEIEQLKELLK